MNNECLTALAAATKSLEAGRELVISLQDINDYIDRIEREESRLRDECNGLLIELAEAQAEVASLQKQLSMVVRRAS